MSVLRLSVGATAVGLLVSFTASKANAGLPDPSRSWCAFPDVLPCPGTVSVDVVIRDAFNDPIGSCLVRAQLLLDEDGSFEPGQQTEASGLTNGLGEVSLTFSNGILGHGILRFRVRTFCATPIQICESETYALMCSPSTAVERQTTILGWGWIKSVYR